MILPSIKLQDELSTSHQRRPKRSTTPAEFFPEELSRLSTVTVWSCGSVVVHNRGEGTVACKLLTPLLTGTVPSNAGAESSSNVSESGASPVNDASVHCTVTLTSPCL